MECPKCRYLLQPFETDCPKCARLAAQGKSAVPAAPPAATSARVPAIPAPAGSARQWTCPQCTYVNTKSMASCEHCGTPHVPQADTPASNRPTAGRIIFSLVVFLGVILALGYFNEPTRAFFTGYSVVYSHTMNTANGPVLLLGVSVRSLNVPPAVTRDIVRNAMPRGKYASVQVGYFTPFHLPLRDRWGQREQQVHEKILNGTADEMYSCDNRGESLTRRTQGEPLNLPPPTDEQYLDRQLQSP